MDKAPSSALYFWLFSITRPIISYISLLLYFQCFYIPLALAIFILYLLHYNQKSSSLKVAFRILHKQPQVLFIYKLALELWSWHTYRQLVSLGFSSSLGSWKLLWKHNITIYNQRVYNKPLIIVKDIIS